MASFLKITTDISSNGLVFSFTVTVNGKRAGRAYFERRKLDCKWIGCVSLAISKIYRLIRIKTKLIKKIEELTEKEGLHELWISTRNKIVLKKKYPVNALPASEGEPYFIKQIRETLVSLHEENVCHPNLKIHPAFQDIVGMYETKNGTFGASPLMEVWEILKSFIKPGMRFLDLGAGDGRVVYLAASLGALATGVETDATLVQIAQKATPLLLQKGWIESRQIHFQYGNFFEYDFSEFDLLYYFGNGSKDESQLEKKLSKELRSKAYFILNGGEWEITSLTKMLEKPPFTVYQRTPLAGTGG